MRNTKRKKKQIGYHVAAGVMDVLGVAASALAIVVLVLMLGSLYSWVHRDLTVTFADLTDNVKDAVMITDGKNNR